MQFEKFGTIDQKASDMEFYTPECLAAARQAAEQMIANAGDDVVSFEYGRQGSVLYVSTDRTKVVGTKTLDVDGTTVYIGIKP